MYITYTSNGKIPEQLSVLKICYLQTIKINITMKIVFFLERHFKAFLSNADLEREKFQALLRKHAKLCMRF